MKIAVVGIWHLGAVYSACLADIGHTVVAIDPDEAVIAAIESGQMPVHEPGLDELVAKQRSEERLRFSATIAEVVDQDLVWLCVDTPVDDEESADTSFVEDLARHCLKPMTSGGVLVVSSQLPLGTGDRLQEYADELGSGVRIVCSPENLRLGSAIRTFMEPDRVVIGADDQRAARLVRECLTPLDTTIVEMSLRSAELTKHALNAFLATSVVFANEISRLAGVYATDANEVHVGLASDNRIGPRAYLRPGGPIAGGTLLRDIEYLSTLADDAGLELPTISSVKASNIAHKQWAVDRVIDLNKEFFDPVLVIGLAYKSGTDTLRRSFGLDMINALEQASIEARVFDSRVGSLPEEYANVALDSVKSIRVNPPATVAVCADDPEFDIAWNALTESGRDITVVDVGGVVEGRSLEVPDQIRLISPGTTV